MRAFGIDTDTTLGDGERQRLIEAVESSSDGFALFDAGDRLILCNAHFREIYPGLVDLIVPGVSFAAIARAAAERCVVRDHGVMVDAWLENRQSLYRDPNGPILQHHVDGRWIQINERRTRDGGTDGWQVLHALKTDPTTREIPVILMSIVDQKELGFRLGANDYIVKPWPAPWKVVFPEVWL